MKFPFFVVCFSLCLLPTALFAQEELKPSEILFTPLRYYVGDRITLQFKLKVPQTTILSTPIYEDSDRLHVESININQKEDYALIFVEFKAFTPGLSSIAFNFQSVTTTPITYNVDSIFSMAPKELQPVYEPLMLEGSRLLAAFVLAALIAIPILIYFIIKMLRRIFAILLLYIKSPYKDFNKKAKYLLKNNQLDHRTFYFTLLDSFRFFLFTFAQEKAFRSATAKELALLLATIYEKKDVQAIINLCERSDLVKFGGLEVTSEQRLADLTLLQVLAKKLPTYKGPITDDSIK